MAALIEAARSARLEARRLRLEERRLRTTMRANRAIHEELLAAAAAARAAGQERWQTLPSPWSQLEWSHCHRELAGVLIPLPSG